MVEFRVRIPDDVARRFEAAAIEFGGRSILLHRLISQAAGPAKPGADVAAAPPGAATSRLIKVDAYLAAGDVARVDAHARAMGLPRATWVAALVRRRVSHQPSFGRPDDVSLIAILTELRRIEVSVRQVTQPMAQALVDGEVIDPDHAYLEALRAEIRSQIRALHKVLQGNLAYWETPA